MIKWYTRDLVWKQNVMPVDRKQTINPFLADAVHLLLHTKDFIVVNNVFPMMGRIKQWRNAVWGTTTWIHSVVSRVKDIQERETKFYNRIMLVTIKRLITYATKRLAFTGSRIKPVQWQNLFGNKLKRLHALVCHAIHSNVTKTTLVKINTTYLTTE